MKSFGLTVLTYLFLSVLLCGGPLMPIALLTLYRDHLGAPGWILLVAAAAAIAVVASRAAGRRLATQRFALPMFVAFWMLLSAGLVGGYATALRAVEVARFKPDSYVASWFVSSLQNAPADFQFFVHAAAMKDCKPYAWSYREMAFYELSPTTVVNLGAFPREWLEPCGIRRWW
ncbi:hypothetical protein [Pleomorphomonas sp. JP5]|uniref:hypothetical protein n=1 Tax=Pleomorphomonas sp. JP5 TaxID=2942998 RepID=UPI0020445F4E|nr:hypothetical protein [Pleomorphomonas sp. JP5]MCM5557372.1 hypothetical protein [Pleomorphomonas sp. JP5]